MHALLWQASAGGPGTPQVSHERVELQRSLQGVSQGPALMAHVPPAAHSVQAGQLRTSTVLFHSN